MATKHNIEVKVFIDNEGLINTGSVTDTYDGGRFGIARSPSILKGKDKVYVNEELIKHLDYLIKYSKDALKDDEKERMEWAENNSIAIIKTKPKKK